MKMNLIEAVMRSVVYRAMRLDLLIVLGSVSATAWAGAITLSSVQCTLQFNADPTTGCTGLILVTDSPEKGVTTTLFGRTSKNLVFIHADVASDTLPLFSISETIDASVTYDALVRVKLGAPENIGLELIAQVPVLVHTAGFAICNSTGFFSNSLASSTVTIGGNLVGSAACGPKPGGANFDKPTEGDFPPRVVETVRMKLHGNLSLESGMGFADATASFDARADPTFEIDPTFAFANYFEVITSPDTSSDVPEPGFMGILGLGCIVWLLRRRYSGGRAHTIL